MTHALKLQALPAQIKLSATQLELGRQLRRDALTHQVPDYAKPTLGQIGPYSCLGCLEEHVITLQDLSLKTKSLGLMTDSRRQMLMETFLHPTTRAALETTLGGKFTVQALFMQAYEPGVSGPGGVIAWHLPHEVSTASYAYALLFWHWRNEDTYRPPRPEAEAAELLWDVIQYETPHALRWLATLAPGEHRIPPGLRREVYPLLGTPAWQRLLAEYTRIRASLTALNTLEVRG